MVLDREAILHKSCHDIDQSREEGRGEFGSTLRCLHELARAISTKVLGFPLPTCPSASKVANWFHTKKAGARTACRLWGGQKGVGGQEEGEEGVNGSV